MEQAHSNFCRADIAALVNALARFAVWLAPEMI
jgi:hypothetical protein